jgi:hypothetical protein
VFEHLREFTPKAEERQAVELLSPDKVEEAIEAVQAVRAAAAAQEMVDEDESATADEGSCQQAALKIAYDLQLQPAFPAWQDKVVLVAGCLTEPQVFLERIESPPGDSGWFVGLVEPELGAPPHYEAMPLAALMALRPALLTASALPPGYLAVFSHDELVAVVDPTGEDLWERHLRSLAEEQLKDKSGGT